MSTANDPQLHEVEMLRKTNAELTEKSRTRKAKIAELESSLTELQGKLSTAEIALHDATVGMPLRQLAATISPVPDLWITEFDKHFKLEMRDRMLTVLDTRGEVVMADNQPIEFTANSVAKFVTDSSKEDLAVFRHITAGSLASGGGASPDRADTEPTISNPKPKRRETIHSQFGLR